MVGEPLFERRPKGLLPTPIGEVFIRHAGALIGELDATMNDIEAFRAGISGTVRIGTVTGPAVGYVVPAVQRLKSEAPHCEVSIEVAPSVELVDGLLAGDFDMVLARVPPDVDPRMLAIRRGRVEEVRFVTREGHPIQNGETVGFDRLVDMTCIIQRTGMPIREAVEQAFVNRNLPVPRDTIDTASLVVSVSYLKTSNAVAAMTSEVIGLFEGSEGLRVVPMREHIILPPYHVIHRRNQALTPICERFCAMLIDRISA